MKILNLLILVFLNFVCCANNQQEPNEQKVDWIGKIEDYFNNKLDSVKSDFKQFGDRSDVSTGKIFLKRKKGLVKLYYNDPNPNIVIIKDDKLTHFDRDLKEKTVMSVYSSPLAFFLEKKVDLKNNVEVTVLDESLNSVIINLKKKEDESGGAIALIFEKNPFQLKSWIILENDSSNRQVQLVLENTKFNASFSDKEFDRFSLGESEEGK